MGSESIDIRATIVNALGHTYAYDALNRLTRISGAAGPLITYTWDGYALGKLSQIQDASGGTQYQYDPYSRLSAKTQTLGGLSFTVGYAWNPVGQLTQVTTPSGNQIGYAYAHGKINAITVNGQPLLTNISHEPFGPISGWTWGNGLPHLRAHGLDGEVQLIESAIAQNYGYDAAGQLTHIHQWSQLAPPQYDTVNSYGYDAGGRLTQANTQAQLPTGPYATTQGYAYDANGNRSQLSSNSALTHYAYSANRLTNSTGSAAKTYTYDAAGRMTGDGSYTYGYNALGRLVTAQSGSRNIGSYAYNALGQRVSKAGVRFVHDESGHLLGEYDPRGNLIQELVWLEGLPVASLRPGPKGGKTTVAFYIHPDHLGTPRQITDSNNQIVWRWDSPDPFGSALPDENPDNGKGKRNGVFEFNLRFAGQYYDKETGRNDNWWRVYDSGTGRYTTSDPIGLGGGVNRYAYANSAPTMLTDSLGLWSASVELYAGIGGGINVSYSNGTLELTGRVGVGLGGGLGYEPQGEPSPHSNKCDSGHIARTTLNLQAGVGAGPFGVGGSFTAASGNAVTTKVGGGYSSVSKAGLADNSKGLGVRLGGSVGVDIGSYSNWGDQQCGCR